MGGNGGWVIVRHGHLFELKSKYYIKLKNADRWLSRLSKLDTTVQKYPFRNVKLNRLEAYFPL